MEEMKRILFTGLVFSFLAAPASALRVEKMTYTKLAPSGLSVPVEMEVVSGEALVKFSAATTVAEKKANLEAVGAIFVEDLPMTGGWTHVVLPAGISVPAGLTVLRGVPGIVEVAPNHAYRPLKIPNDPSYASQYHLSNINAPAGWEFETGGSSRVTIAVMDAGIDLTHPDLASKLVLTNQFCDPGACTSTTGPGSCADPSTDSLACVAETDPDGTACNHGTRVAGVAAAVSNNGSQVSGVSWEAQLVSLRVFRDADCSVSCGNLTISGCATDDTAIIHAVNHSTGIANTPAVGRLVLNVSIGGAAPCAAAVQTAFDEAEAAPHNIVIVVSAGNNGSEVNAPGICNKVIPVGATDENNNVANFSSRGAQLAANGVVAPGVNIVTTDFGGGVTASATGTSFSAPVVSGLAALILAKDPTLSAAQVKANLRGGTVGIGLSSLNLASSAKAPVGIITGAGLVDAFRTLKLTAEGTLAGFEGDEKVIAFPNPFRPGAHGAVTITIPLSIQSANTSIRIYTMGGEIVRDLGASTSWDGKNDFGTDVATGVYLILAKTDVGNQKARVALIR